MLSLEKAKKLKDAGLKWRPKLGDMFYYRRFGNDEEGEIAFADKEDVKNQDETQHYIETGHWVWVPHLDQMLAWIGKCGYSFNIGSEMVLDTYTGEWKPTGKYMCCCGHTGKDAVGEFKALFLDEAVAQAVLWILEQEEA
jgi:hypothetical protein